MCLTPREQRLSVAAPRDVISVTAVCDCSVQSLRSLARIHCACPSVLVAAQGSPEFGFLNHLRGAPHPIHRPSVYVGMPVRACCTCSMARLHAKWGHLCVCVCVCVSECLFFFDRKTSRTALLFLRSFLSTAFLALFLSRGSQRVCVWVGAWLTRGFPFYQVCTADRSRTDILSLRAYPLIVPAQQATVVVSM